MTSLVFCIPEQVNTSLAYLYVLISNCTPKSGLHFSWDNGVGFHEKILQLSLHSSLSMWRPVATNSNALQVSCTLRTFFLAMVCTIPGWLNRCTQFVCTSSLQLLPFKSGKDLFVNKSFAFLPQLLMEMFLVSNMAVGIARHMSHILTFLDLSFRVFCSTALWGVENFKMQNLYFNSESKADGDLL